MTTTAIANTQTETMIVKRETLARTLAIDGVLKDSHGLMIEHAGNPVTHGVVVASTMQRIREMLTPEYLADVMMLRESVLGFVTDRPPGSKRKDRQGNWVDNVYSDEQIRDCLLTGLLQGLRLVGGEIAILGGNTYSTAKALKRLLDELPGFSWIQRPTVGASIERRGPTALIEGRCEFRFGGEVKKLVFEKSDAADYRLAVNTYDTDKAAMVRGRAKRDIERAVYEIVTGMSISVVGDDMRPDNVEKTPAIVDATEQPETNLEAPDEREVKAFFDRVETWLNKSLESVAKPEDIEPIEAKALALIEEHGKPFDSDSVEALRSWVGDACKAKRKQTRGENSNKNKP